MRPRPNRTLPPNFSELPAGHFEEMTRALHSHEPGIKSAQLYKTQRQRQFGIDVLAECRDGEVEVSSCKCYGKLAKGEIATFSNDFLEHERITNRRQLRANAWTAASHPTLGSWTSWSTRTSCSTRRAWMLGWSARGRGRQRG